MATAYACVVRDNGHPSIQPAARWRIVSAGDRRWSLIADGAIQSVDPASGAAGYWGFMLPDERPMRALLLGFGGGTIATLLTARFGSIPILGVDHDPSLQWLHHHPDAAGAGLSLPNVQLVIADAFEFVSTEPGPFDFVAVDLYNGPAMARGMLSRSFLRQIVRLAPGGHVVFNLHRNRRLSRALDRLTKTFQRVRVVAIEENVVVHGRVP